jgi:lysophospholipase L1-like esterase
MTADHIEVIVLNKGIGGNSTVDLLKRIEVDVTAQNPDLVILMVGTNDMLNSRKMRSYQEYSANLNKIVKTLKDSGAQVLLMSSPPADSVYLFQRHDKTLFKQAPNVIMDSVSCIVKQVALKYDALFINVFNEFSALNIPRHNEDLFIRNLKNSDKADGVHPTPLGYHFIAQLVYQYLKEKDLLTTYRKIICLGDSITHGAGATGGGTVDGENYPSYLYRKLNHLQP